MKRFQCRPLKWIVSGAFAILCHTSLSADEKCSHIIVVTPEQATLTKGQVQYRLADFRKLESSTSYQNPWTGPQIIEQEITGQQFVEMLDCGGFVAASTAKGAIIADEEFLLVSWDNGGNDLASISLTTVSRQGVFDLGEFLGRQPYKIFSNRVGRILIAYGAGFNIKYFQLDLN